MNFAEKPCCISSGPRSIPDGRARSGAVTPSAILLAYPTAKVDQFSSEGINEIAYQDTEHYQITKAFLNHPEKMLARLFAPDD